MVRAYQNSQSPPGIDPNAFQTVANAFAADFAADFYVEICRGIDPVSQINLVNTELLIPLSKYRRSNFYQVLVIKVVPNSNPECSWDNHSHLDNCNFLKDAANAVWNIHVYGSPLTPTIFSTAHIWKKIFGSSCDFFATDTGAIL